MSDYYPHHQSLPQLDLFNFFSAQELNFSAICQGDVFTMDEQIQNFKSTLQELSLLLGNETADLIARSLFFICIGSNDYINNYLHPLQMKEKRFPPAAFAQLLIQEYRRQIKVVSLCLF